MGRRYRCSTYVACRLGACGLALLLAVVLSHLMTQSAANAEEPAKIRVEVTDQGFKPNVIEVERGKLIELTFVWAHQAFLGEEHIMVLDGYKLETEEITNEHLETTLEFVADKPGSFNFKCDLDCELHDSLQAGQLKVGASGAVGDAKALVTKTTLALSPSSWVTTGDPINLMAVLSDPKGAPVPKAEVRFYLDTEFAGTKGHMPIGTTKTDANGVALLDYRPTHANRQQRITAQFAGMGVYGESEQAIEISQVGVPAPAYAMASTGLNGVWEVAPKALAGVILGVWALFGFVLYQTFGVFWLSRRGKERKPAKITSTESVQRL